jgi:hypothetical protein
MTKRKTDKEVAKISNEKKDGVSLTVWLKRNGIKVEEYHPRQVYAGKHNMVIATIEEWDHFFKKY